MINLIITAAFLYVFFYTLPFGIWVFRKKNISGGTAVILLIILGGASAWIIAH